MSSPSTMAAADPAAGKGPEPLPGILRLEPYVQGKAALPGTSEPIKLSSNESCFGPNPAAVTAYQDAATELHRYADGGQTLLREAIAKTYGLDATRVICGNGSAELISLFTQCFVGDGTELLLSQHYFVMCSIYGKAQGADIVPVPEKNYTTDVDAMLERVTDRTRMVMIANPNNPTGTYLNIDEIDRLVAGTPDNVLILLDGAYAEYVWKQDYDAGLRWADRANVVMTRTFSKIHGLAGLRIGWAYGPRRIVDLVNRLRTPFNASAPAMAAAAASIADQDYIEQCREHNRRWLKKITRELTALGFNVVPSVANFYLIDFGDRSDKTAAGALGFLETRGIIPRPGAADNQLRITVGTDKENEAVLAALRDFAAS